MGHEVGFESNVWVRQLATVGLLLSVGACSSADYQSETLEYTTQAAKKQEKKPKQERVTLCHQTGEGKSGHSIVVAAQAVSCHLAHGDTVGECPDACTLESCNDGDACTVDTCGADAACSHEPANCDDGNPCTVEACDPVSGCVSTPAAQALACDDGNECTAADSCSGGACGGQPIPGCCRSAADCADGDLCTADVCVNRACVNAPVECATGDRCLAAFCNPTDGSCEAAPIACNDGNPCTDDYCSASEGCRSSPSATGKPCDDGNACTQFDVCEAAECVSGEPVTCAPPNSCHVSRCDSVAGCLFAPLSGVLCSPDSLPACSAVPAACSEGVCEFPSHAGYILARQNGHFGQVAWRPIVAHSNALDLPANDPLNIIGSSTPGDEAVLMYSDSSLLGFKIHVAGDPRAARRPGERFSWGCEIRREGSSNPSYDWSIFLSDTSGLTLNQASVLTPNYLSAEASSVGAAGALDSRIDAAPLRGYYITLLVPLYVLDLDIRSSIRVLCGSNSEGGRFFPGGTESDVASHILLPGPFYPWTDFTNVAHSLGCTAFPDQCADDTTCDAASGACVRPSCEAPPAVELRLSGGRDVAITDWFGRMNHDACPPEIGCRLVFHRPGTPSSADVVTHAPAFGNGTTLSLRVPSTLEPRHYSVVVANATTLLPLFEALDLALPP